MLRDVLTEDELKALLGDEGVGTPAQEMLALFENDGRKLLHALVRNQLRQLHMIEELQSELRKLQSAAMDTVRGAGRESAAGLEPLPLPFMKQPLGGSVAATTSNGPDSNAPASELSRKDRHKRNSRW
jgi:hypothetical protein